MSHQVKLERLLHDGSDGQIPVRRPSALNGVEYANPADFFVGGLASLTFGSGPPATQAVTVAVADGQVRDTSRILAQVMIGAGRDSDELELDDVLVTVGKVTPGVGFDLVVRPSSNGSQPHGTYLVSYQRQ